MVIELLTRWQITYYGSDLKRWIEGLAQTFVQEEVLVKGIFPFFMEFGEMGFRIQLAKQGTDLLDGCFSA
jgi:hypothetical protein